jgi:hypothetical protein
MLQFVDNCSLNLGERVECYFNSKKQLISVRSLDITNKNYLKIVAYAEYLHLEDVSFSYSPNNHRKIIKGIYAGGLPVVPNREHMILHDETGFYTTSDIQVKGSKYAVCFKNIILAEQPVRIGVEMYEPVYKKWIL